MSPSALLAVLLATAPSAAPGASTATEPGPEPETPLVVAAPAVETPIVIDNPRVSETAAVEPPVVVESPSTNQIAATEANKGTVRGVVLDANTGEAIVGALVTLSCECLAAPLTLHTNTRGIYDFTKLPSGTYEVTAVSQRASVRKLFALPPGAKLQASFRFDPSVEQDRSIVVTAAPVTTAPRPPIGREPEEIEAYTLDVITCVFEPLRPLPTPLERAERHNPTFGMQRSLFDGGGMQELLRRPPVTQHLP